MDISMEQYRVFYTVASHCSFSKAAEDLFVSQSAVSQTIKTLEKKLGFPLLIRTTKRVDLTIDGTILFNYLEQAFSLINSAEAKLQMRQDPFHGELIIASTDTLCKYFLLPKLKLLTQQHPHIKIKIINKTSLYCLTKLEKAQVDLAVINLPEYMPNDRFVVEASYTFKDAFITAPDSPLPIKMSLEEIAGQSLLLLDEKSITRQFLNSLFRSKGIMLTPEIELQNVDLLIEMAHFGFGVACVPDICVTNGYTKVIHPTIAMPDRRYGIVSYKPLGLTPAAQTFLSLLQS